VTAYVSAGGNLTPINTATNRPGKPIKLGGAGVIAFTPNGKTGHGWSVS
jgi:hypothetical protein